MNVIKDNKIRTLRSPVYLNIDITSQCNWQCKFCYVGKGNDGTQKSSNFVPYERFVDMLDRVAEAEVFSINLFGGEPLLHPDIVRIVRYAKSKGLDIGFVSNGSQITKELVDELTPYIKSCSISVHGFGKTHDALTGIEGSYTKSTEALKALAGKIEPGICYTLVRQNLGELKEFCKYLADSHLTTSLALGRFIPTGTGHSNKADLEISSADFNGALRSLKEVGTEHKEMRFTISDGVPFCAVSKDVKDLAISCTSGVTAAAIDEAGNVKFCSGSPYVAGNIFEEKLEKIWQESDLFKHYRSLEWMDKRCRECGDLECCTGGCKITKSTEKPFATDVWVSK